MNSALFHAARPGDIRSGGLGGREGAGNRPGMREAAAMAKEMGFDQDFGPQAANMWKMLDDLAVTDSAAYAEMARAGAEALRKPQGKFFVPVPGFVVKASLVRPWAPPPSTDDSDRASSGTGRKVVENAPASTKVFINFCGHEGVSPPIDQADRPVDDSKEGRNASGLRIPMFVSRVRETTDHSDERALAVDVVFHPWVMRSCKGEPMFRDQVVALATGWITQEHPGLVVARRRKLLKLCAYKGGGGPKGATPVAFPIEDASLQTDSPGARQHTDLLKPKSTSGDGSKGTTTSGGLLDDPKSLLAAIKHAAADEDGPATATVPPSSTAAAAAANGHGGSTEKPSSSAAATTPAGEVGQGPAAALGLKPVGGAAKRGDSGNDDPAAGNRDILLPGALAGLASAGGGCSGGRRRGNGSQGTEGKRGGDGPGQGRGHRGPLISEIIPETAKDVSAARGEDGSKAKRTSVKGGGNGGSGGERPSVVKKGFLSSSSSTAGGKGVRERAPLYPPGGSENGSEPSAYVKLMSRCKVVDTRDHSKEEMDAAMQAHASGGATSSRPPSDAPLPRSDSKPSPANTGGGAAVVKQPAVKKGFLDSGGRGGVLYGEEGSREGGAVGVKGGRGNKVDREFDRLVALADPELGDGAGGADGKAEGGADDPITEQLAQLAKILGPAAQFPEPAPAGAGTGAEAGTYADLGKPPSSVKNDNTTKPGGAPATNGDNKAPGGARQATADAQKTATSASSTEAATPRVPAPTSTITRSGNNTTTAQECTPGRTVSSPEANASALENATTAKADCTAAAAAQKEREPVYRVEEVPPPSANPGGGAARTGKRSFVVTIDLPGLIDGDGVEGNRPEPARSQQQQAGGADGGNEAVKSADDNSSSSGGGRKRTGKGPSLSEFELDVLPTALQLRIPGKYRLRLDMPCTVDDENVSAKFNKSRAVLKVSVQEK